MSYIQPNEPTKALTISSLLKMRNDVEKITSLTAYDASFGTLFDQIGIDIILIGDSLGNVIQGHSSTLPVLIEDMIYHTACVSRNIKRSYVVSDMPFASYGDMSQALKNAALLMQAGAKMVKIEGCMLTFNF